MTRTLVVVFFLNKDTRVLEVVDLKKSIKLLKVQLVNGYGKNHGGHVQASAVWKLHMIG